MKTFQKKFVALTAVAGLAVLGAACEADTEVESPGVEEPADDVVVDEGDEGTDVTVEDDATAETDAGTGTESTDG